MKKATKHTLIIAGAFLLIAAILFSTYIFARVNILLKGDLSIALEPKQAYILAERGSEKDIIFNISIENRNFCEAYCTYSFRNLGTGEVLDKEGFIGGRGTELIKKYTLSTPSKGTGQVAYELVAECANKRTFLCQTSGDTRVRSSFVTVGYELSLEEKEAVEELRMRLISFLDSLLSLDIKSQELAGKADALSKYFPVDEISSDSSLLWGEVEAMIAVAEEMKREWAAEEYSILNKSISENEAALNTLSLFADNIGLAIKEKEDIHRRAVRKVEAFRSRLLSFDNIIKAYLLAENTSKEGVFNDTLIEYLGITAELNNGTRNGHRNIDLGVAFLEKRISTEETLAENLLRRTAEEAIRALEREKNESLPIPRGFNESFARIDEVCGKLNSTVEPANETSKLIERVCRPVSYSGVDISRYNLSIRMLPDNITISAVPRISATIFEHTAVCCVFGECGPCCEEKCGEEQRLYPVILLHGHAISRETSFAYSLSGFEKIRDELKNDGFIDAGTLLPSSEFMQSERGVIGRFGKPVVFGTTYYVGAYDSEGNILSVPSKSEEIAEYARRLNRTIELARWKTGAEKVNIIAYSMGGLVARKYLADFGEGKVNKLIMIATPNKGIAGRIESFCPIAGASTECLEMAATSQFMNELNNPRNNLRIPAFVIAGKGCQMDGKNGDGIVLLENALLPYSLNFEIEGNCEGKNLHEKIRDTDAYPKVYETIRNALRG